MQAVPLRSQARRLSIAFHNTQNGTYSHTADESEKSAIVGTLPRYNFERHHLLSGSHLARSGTPSSAPQGSGPTMLGHRRDPVVAPHPSASDELEMSAAPGWHSTNGIHA